MPRFNVVAAIFEQNGRILLQFRTNTENHPEHWGLPAGRVEMGESVQQAIAREMQEELNVIFRTEREPDYECTTADGRTCAAFIVSTYEGTITNNEPDLCKELAWHDFDELPVSTYAGNDLAAQAS